MLKYLNLFILSFPGNPPYTIIVVSLVREYFFLQHFLYVLIDIYDIEIHFKIIKLVINIIKFDNCSR